MLSIIKIPKIKLETSLLPLSSSLLYSKPSLKAYTVFFIIINFMKF